MPAAQALVKSRPGAPTVRAGPLTANGGLLGGSGGNTIAVVMARDEALLRTSSGSDGGGSPSAAGVTAGGSNSSSFSSVRLATGGARSVELQERSGSVRPRQGGNKQC